MQIVRTADELIQKLERGGNITKVERASTIRTLTMAIAKGATDADRIRAAAQLIHLQNLTGAGRLSDPSPRPIRKQDQVEEFRPLLAAVANAPSEMDALLAASEVIARQHRTGVGLGVRRS